MNVNITYTVILYIINKCKLFLLVEEASNKNGQTLSDAELGVQFTEIFIKKPENVTLLLGLLEVLYCQFCWTS